MGGKRPVTVSVGVVADRPRYEHAASDLRARADDVLRANQQDLAAATGMTDRLMLDEARVEAIARALAPFEFDKMFGNFFESVIESGAKQAFDKSVERYLAALAAD